MTMESCPVHTYDKFDTCQTNQMPKCLHHLFVHVEAAYTCPKHYTVTPNIAHAHVARYLHYSRQSKVGSSNAPAGIGPRASELPTTVYAI